ncbi:hypothetical protein JKP88DRAFT_277781 [Tribonema minus]|uniref:Uncharacterized protein n=1 Tax=Tribonema minus TaxID=303371 RepID=A0A835Z411_9STRA|nr:hypothetical protein JKP88DRAFT_277781 [Tribonema minus]
MPSRRPRRLRALVHDAQCRRTYDLTCCREAADEGRGGGDGDGGGSGNAVAAAVAVLVAQLTCASTLPRGARCGASPARAAVANYEWREGAERSSSRQGSRGAASAECAATALNAADVALAAVVTALPIALDDAMKAALCSGGWHAGALRLNDAACGLATQWDGAFLVLARRGGGGDHVRVLGMDHLRVAPDMTRLPLAQALTYIRYPARRHEFQRNSFIDCRLHAESGIVAATKRKEHEWDDNPELKCAQGAAEDGEEGMKDSDSGDDDNSGSD